MTSEELYDKLLKRTNPNAFGGIGFYFEWVDLINDLDNALSAIDPNYTIFQVKDKFGTLRFYYDTEIENEDDRELMHALVDAAELSTYDSEEY